MSDRNNYNNFDNENFRRFQQQHRESVVRAKQIAREREEAHPVVSYGYGKKSRDCLKDLLTVDSKQLYGKKYVTDEIESHSKAVAVMGTVANGFNIITAFPLVFFAMKDIPLFGFFLALAVNLGVLKFSNKAVEVAAANKPGNQVWSKFGLCGVIALNVVQSLVSGVGSQLFLDKPGISTRLAGELVYEQVIESLEANVEASQFNPDAIESKKICRELEAELANTPLNTAKSDRLYTQAHGSYEDSQRPLEQRSYYGLPVHLLPYCPRAREEEKQLTEQLAAANSELQDTTAIIAENGSLAYLKAKKLDTYQQHFDENEELKSGMTATKLATQMFVEKIVNGDWASLGLTMYIFSLSVITSAVSVLLIATHAKREDIQMSWSNTVARERDAYIEKKIAEFNQSAKREDSTLADFIPYSSTDVITSSNGNGNGKHH